jgi:hypothetical protein
VVDGRAHVHEVEGPLGERRDAGPRVSNDHVLQSTVFPFNAGCFAGGISAQNAVRNLTSILPKACGMQVRCAYMAAPPGWDACVW